MNIVNTFLATLLLASISIERAHAKNTYSPFVAVFVDKKTEQKLGSFPYDRRKYATALEIIRKSSTKAVILKYFLDQPKPGDGDDLLALEISKIPVLLQAKMDSNEPKPNDFPERFYLGEVSGPLTSLLNGNSGWLPLEKFSKSCAGIGFVDLANATQPLTFPAVEIYKNRPVKSLAIAAVELELGKQSKIEAGKSISLNEKNVSLSSNSELQITLPAIDYLKPLSFLDLIENKISSAALKGKIVVLGYEGTKGDRFETSLGPMGPHRLFFYTIEDLYKRFK